MRMLLLIDFIHHSIEICTWKLHVVLLPHHHHLHLFCCCFSSTFVIMDVFSFLFERRCVLHVFWLSSSSSLFCNQMFLFERQRQKGDALSIIYLVCLVGVKRMSDIRNKNRGWWVRKSCFKRQEVFGSQGVQRRTSRRVIIVKSWRETWKVQNMLCLVRSVVNSSILARICIYMSCETSLNSSLNDWPAWY